MTVVQVPTPMGESLFTVKTVAWAHPDAVRLREQQRIAISDKYEVDNEPGTIPPAEDIMLFCVAYRGEEPVGCGGLRRVDNSSVEVKRMFVSLDARGSGAADVVMKFLEQSARDQGYGRLLLETGDRLESAIRFYTRSGFRIIPNFGYYAGVDTSICMEKIL